MIANFDVFYQKIEIVPIWNEDEKIYYYNLYGVSAEADEQGQFTLENIMSSSYLPLVCHVLISLQDNIIEQIIPNDEEDKNA